MRYARRRDTTHAPIVADLEALFFSVLDLTAVGGGCPDILIGKHHRSMLCELKSPKKIRGGKDLGENQIEFAAAWRGCPVIRAETTAEILAAWAGYTKSSA